MIDVTNIGSSCAEDAPMPHSIRYRVCATLRGISNTTTAENKLRRDHEELVRSLSAISEGPKTLPQLQPFKEEKIQTSKISRASGNGYVSIDYDNWKYLCTNECTREVLPEALVENAIIDELHDLNANVWNQITSWSARGG